MPIRKRPRTSTLDAALSHRQLGQLSSTDFSRRLAASQDLVLRFDILRKLDKHHGCVNTLSFNAAGDVLVSGSDDTRVILWDWETGNVKLSFHSGHESNVFQAKFVPYTDDRSIVTCAADGKVRHAQILESRVETKLLAQHQGRAHKLALIPECPHTFYTCAEDGLVQHIDLRTGTATTLLCCRSVHFRSSFDIVSLNAIAIDPRNPNLFAVGGSDQFTRLYDIRQYKWDASSELDRPVDLFCPPHLVKDEHVGITGLAFSDQSELLVSYNDEFIYLFAKDMGLGPDPKIISEASDDSDGDDMSLNISVDLSLSKSNENVKATPQAYIGHRNSATVKGVNFFGPKCDYVVSGSDCGRIFIWKKKSAELVRVMEADKRIVNCIESHPHATVLASSGIESDIKIWVPRAVDKATLPTNIEKDRIPPFYSCYGYDDEDDDDFIYFDDDTGDDDDDKEDEDEEDENAFDDSDGEDYSDDSNDSGGSLENDNNCRNEDGEGDGISDFIFDGDMDEHGDFGSKSCCDDDDDDDDGDDDETEGKTATEELDAAIDVSGGHDVTAVLSAKAKDNP